MFFGRATVLQHANHLQAERLAIPTAYKKIIPSPPAQNEILPELQYMSKSKVSGAKIARVFSLRVNLVDRASLINSRLPAQAEPARIVKVRRDNGS